MGSRRATAPPRGSRTWQGERGRPQARTSRSGTLGNVIRLATSDDIDAVTELVAEFCAVDDHEFDHDRVQRALRPLLADDTYGVVWVVTELGDEPRGESTPCDRALVSAEERAEQAKLKPERSERATDPLKPRAGLTGYAVVTWGYAIESGGRDALLDEIYLRDRGLGRGGELLGAILDDCRRRGLSQVFLETESHNERVRGFYARHGFTVDPSVWMSRPL